MHTCIYATQDNSSSGKDMMDEGEGEDKLVIHVCTCHLCDGGKKCKNCEMQHNKRGEVVI